MYLPVAFFVVYVLVLGLIILFEVEYCLAANSVTSVSWCSVSFIGQSLRLALAHGSFCRGQHVLGRWSIHCARRYLERRCVVQ